MVSIADAVDRFRRPEYTGANRCMPCTAVNLLVAAVVSGVIAVLVPWVGVVLFVVFVGTISLRGYLVRRQDDKPRNRDRRIREH